MIKNLTNLGMERNWKEAIVFYIAYLLLGILIGAMVGGIVGILYPDRVLELAEKAGLIAGAIYVLVLYFTIYIKKEMESFLFILLGIITFAITLLLGAIFSLIIVAFFTTRDNKLEVEVDEGIEESETS